MVRSMDTALVHESGTENIATFFFLLQFVVVTVMHMHSIKHVMNGKNSHNIGAERYNTVTLK